MVLQSLLGFASFTLFCLLMSAVSHSAFASRIGSNGGKHVAADSSGEGICASAVTVHGYKCQELQVTTKDGYVLSLQRIPEGRAEPGNRGTKKQPVIIQHGVLVVSEQISQAIMQGTIKWYIILILDVIVRVKRRDRISWYS